MEKKVNYKILVLKKIPICEIIKQKEKYEGKKVFWVGYPNDYTSSFHLLGVGNTPYEAWKDAYECILENNMCW